MTLQRFSRQTLGLALVLMTSSVLAWNWNNPNSDATRVPNRYLKFDVAQVGLDGVGDRVRLLKFDYIGGRLRAGISVADIWVSTVDMEDVFWGIAPAHIGFTVASLPARTSFFWSRGLDVYVQAEAAIGVRSWSSTTGLDVEMCADADYYGIGVGLYAGWGAYYNFSRFFTRDWANMGYVGIRLRLLTFGAGFR
jgi:hypothetical protein